MTREEWEDVLYAAVPDEVVQDQLNDYVLSLEWEITKLQELLANSSTRADLAFVRKLQECTHNREPIMLFGATYVPADDVGLLKMIVAGVEIENAKLRELCANLYAEMIAYSDAPNYNASIWALKLCELGIEVNE